MNYTEEQISLAFNKLPRGAQDVLFTPELDQKVHKIGAENELIGDKLNILADFVNFAILNLVSRQDFSSIIEKELSVSASLAQTLAGGVSREIFASIEGMESQAEKDLLLYGKSDNEEPADIEPQGMVETRETPSLEKPAVAQVSIPTPVKTWEKATDTAPDNLPVEEEVEPLIPPIPAKVLRAEGEEGAAHPFEEKMKRVFTAGQQSMGELVIEPSSQTAAPQAPPRSSDPYREPIE